MWKGNVLRIMCLDSAPILGGATVSLFLGISTHARRTVPDYGDASSFTGAVLLAPESL